MNPTHWHLALNHVPVVGFAGLSILLLVAWFRRSRELTLITLVLLLPVALSALPVFLTGDSAKHMVQGLPAVSDRLEDEHEEISRLALAAALASGLWGIEEKLELGSPIQGNAYTQQQSAELELPHTLWDAAQRLKGSQRARSLFGDAFVDHFAATREWEERELRKTITDWELRRYFEII